MADVTVAGGFTSGETVNARIGDAGAVDGSAAASADGKVTITGLKPNRGYVLIGATSAKRVEVFTGEEGLAVQELGQTLKEVAVVFDAASVPAASASPQNITTPAGTIDVGDTVVYVGRSNTGAGAVTVTGGAAITVADTIPMLFINGTAAAVDLVSQTYRFLVVKKRSNV